MSSQIESAQETLHTLNQSVSLAFDPGADETLPFVQKLHQFASLLVAKAPKNLQLSWVSPHLRSQFPSLSMDNITYQALPVGREFEPFIEALAMLANGARDQTAAQEMSGLVERINASGTSHISPATLDVFIAPDCPHCPQLVRSCMKLAFLFKQVTLRVIDVEFSAQHYPSIRSVPTLIIDGFRTVIGVMSPLDVLDMLIERSDSSYLFKTLSSMVETGQIQRAVQLLTQENGFSAMGQLLAEGTLQQRMGLMLVVEESLSQDPNSLDGSLPHLIPLLSHENSTIRGDTADVLGQIGAPGAKEALSRLLGDEHPDVREIALEALGRLRAPS